MSSEKGSSGPVLRLGLPKGSLQETTQKLLSRAGFDVRYSGRSYFPSIDDPEIECILIRPQEMARYVAQGAMDCGIAGLDWVQENKVDVVELADLEAPWSNYMPIRWVLAAKRGYAAVDMYTVLGKREPTEYTIRLVRGELVRIEVFDRATAAPVFIALFSDAHRNDYVALAMSLRRAGFGVELYPQARKLAAQLKYADRRGFQLALIIGDSEWEAGTCQVKDLTSGASEEVALEGLEAVIARMLD